MTRSNGNDDAVAPILYQLDGVVGRMDDGTGIVVDKEDVATLTQDEMGLLAQQMATKQFLVVGVLFEDNHAVGMGVDAEGVKTTKVGRADDLHMMLFFFDELSGFS